MEISYTELNLPSFTEIIITKAIIFSFL